MCKGKKRSNNWFFPGIIIMLLLLGLLVGIFVMIPNPGNGDSKKETMNTDFVISVTENQEDEYSLSTNNEMGDYVIHYLGLSQVNIHIYGQSVNLDEALRDDIISLEQIIEQAQIDAQNGCCSQRTIKNGGISTQEFIYDDYILYYSDRNQDDVNVTEMVRYIIFCKAGYNLSFDSVCYYIDNNGNIVGDSTEKTQEDIKDTTQVYMTLNGKQILSVMDRSAIQRIEVMLKSAYALGYEPKTFNPGVELLLASDNGCIISVELDLVEDLCRIGTEYYDYGPGMDEDGSKNALRDLLNLLGVTDWPKEVYDEYSDFFGQSNNSTVDNPEFNGLFPFENYSSSSISIVIELSDGSCFSVDDGEALQILETLAFSPVESTEIPAGSWDSYEYIIYISYSSEVEYSVINIGNDTFYIQSPQENTCYIFMSQALDEIIQGNVL